MCLGTFSRRARSLATCFCFARVRIIGTLVPLCNREFWANLPFINVVIVALIGSCDPLTFLPFFLDFRFLNLNDCILTHRDAAVLVASELYDSKLSVIDNHARRDVRMLSPAAKRPPSGRPFAFFPDRDDQKMAR